MSNPCQGESCTLCGAPANHKIEEDLTIRPPMGEIAGMPMWGHPLTAYICGQCFGYIFHSHGNRAIATMRDELKRCAKSGTLVDDARLALETIRDADEDGDFALRSRKVYRDGKPTEWLLPFVDGLLERMGK